MRIDPDLPLPPGTQGHAGIVFLVRNDGRVLLQQRDDIQLPEGYGRWAFPGGGWEPGESPRECAHREMLEETALDLRALRYFRSFELGPSPSGVPVTWHVFFSFESVDESRIEVNEGLAFTFWSPEEAAGLRMNPRDRVVLDAFFQSDQYRGGLRADSPTAAAAVIELDRWGRVLLQLRDRDLPAELHPGTWTLPGGAIESSESPDAAAVREFEEETGVLLEHVSLFRTFNRDEIPAQRVRFQHIYFVDADLAVELLDCNEGIELRYFTPEELGRIDITPWTRPILEEFVVSPAYKRLFH